MRRKRGGATAPPRHSSATEDAPPWTNEEIKECLENVLEWIETGVGYAETIEEGNNRSDLAHNIAQARQLLSDVATELMVRRTQCSSKPT